MLKLSTLCLASSLLIGGIGAALAQDASKQPPTPVPSETSRTGTAGGMQKGDAMKGGEMGGGSGNTGMPGSAPAAEGNKNQDSRTTTSRDR
ncbi:Lipoprotein [Methylorubrum populi]